MRTPSFALVAAAVLVQALPARAGVPQLLGYQGRLLRADGTAATGTASVTFSVFASETGGTPLWTEVQTLGLSDGYYATFLGLAGPPPAGLFEAGARWMEVRVGSETLLPRQQIGAVPYAFSAQSVAGGTANVTSLQVGGQTVVDAGGRLAGTARYAAGAGLEVNDTTQTISLKSCPSGQALLHDDQTWQCAPAATGTVTTVGVAAPLTVTNASSTPQISLPQAGTGSSGFLSSTDWSTFTAKYGASTTCGGDLAGPLSSPAVVRLQSRPVSTTAPTDGQVLKWSATGAQWAPSADANSGGTVTNVTAQAPLTAWTGSTTPEISIAQASGTVDGYLASADWNRFNAKYDAATQCGGDLAGAWAAPLVGKIQGVSVSSATPSAQQVLRFDGSRWTPASLAASDVGGLESGFVALTGDQSIGGAKTFAAAPAFGTPLPVASGGVGTASAAARTFFAGPADASGPPAFRALVTADLAGLGPGLTGLDAGALASGTVPDARLSGAYTSALTFSNAGNSFSGDGAGLVALDAGALASGTVPGGRLAGTYGSQVTFSHSGNAFSGSFSGSGSGLTGLNAGALAGGTLPDGRLAGTYSSPLTLSSTSNVFAGSFSGTGSGNFSGTFSGTSSGTFSGTLVASDSTSTAVGAIRFNAGHFQGYDGSRWLNLDNVPPPAVDSVSPNWGTVAGGTSVTVVGSNFQNGAIASIGGVNCTSTAYNGPGSLTCVTPANSDAGNAKDVKVVNADLQSITKNAAFTYHRPPTVTGATPSVITTTGAMTVTIAGADFVATPTVLFNGANATSVTFGSSVQITAVAPASLSAGTVTLTVRNPDTLSATGTGPTAVVPIAATGGAVTTDASGYRVHTFTASGTFSPQGSGSVEVVVVAGGGGGGCDRAGGGGGGGVVHVASYAVTGGQNVTVTVGAGGTGSTSDGTKGGTGGASAFGTTTASGGGGGGSENTKDGVAGGSGGGSAYGGTGGGGTAGQGNAGGTGTSSPRSPGGGGGAGAAGQNGNTSNPGPAGGDGVQWFGSYYGGGGGAGDNRDGAGSSGPGNGGLGGGGQGGLYSSSPKNGSPGTANTGGGGGGGGKYDDGYGGTGGSGIVIVRYQY